jgi:thiol:disulfide interchange protein
VLLGTVIFLMSSVDLENLLPTIALLFGLWFACWWIGRVPLTAEPGKRARAWAVAATIGLLAAMISFSEGFDALGQRFRGIRGKQRERLARYVDVEIGHRGSIAKSAKESERPDSDNVLPWEPFNKELLQELTASQQTVMVDFTADW